VKSDQGRGWVAVVQGAPRYAAYGGLSGRPALDAILRLARGSCQMVKAPTRGEGERLQVSFSDALAQARARAAAPARSPAPGRPAPAPGPRRPGPPPRR
jgi:hypothetical protein